MTKENQTQKAHRIREEILKAIEHCFLCYEDGEDNSWRCRHNKIVLQLQIEQKLDLDKIKELFSPPTNK